jgi:hypothetical protein
LQSNITGGCYDIVYGNPDNASPTDRPSPTEKEIPDAIALALFILWIGLGLGDFVMGVLLLRYRNRRLLKASQYPMLWLIWSSGVFGMVRITYSMLTPDANGGDLVCRARYWTGHLAFFGVIALLVKTVRVHLLVNTSGLRRVKITTTQVLLATFAIYAVMVFYMVLVSVFSPPFVEEVVTQLITGQDEFVDYCENPNAVLDYVLYSFEAAVFLMAAKLCYDTKDVPDAINETKSIAMSKRALITRDECYELD